MTDALTILFVALAIIVGLVWLVGVVAWAAAEPRR
jgi:hypothetical protein